MIAFILAVCGNVDYVYSFPQSPPSRAAWIEIKYGQSLHRTTCTSPPSRAAWIEMPCNRQMLRKSPASPPSRAAWIEMLNLFALLCCYIVAAFTGGVD